MNVLALDRVLDEDEMVVLRQRGALYVPEDVGHPEAYFSLHFQPAGVVCRRRARGLTCASRG
jgi:hypothetical protein